MKLNIPYLSVLLRQLNTQSYQKISIFLVSSSIIFDQNMTVFSPTQLIFLFDPKKAKTGEAERVVCMLYQKELYKLPMTKDN